MLLVGLTGNIAAGKSTVAAAFAERGATVIDSDVAAREAVAANSPALAAIVTRFGPEMLLADGTLDRATLGALVFNDPAARQALEAIVHPAVEAARQRQVAAARTAGSAITICDIPLLFEARLAWQFPRVILVDAPTASRVSRLMQYRAMSESAAAARIRSQLPAPLKRVRADRVIDNTSDLATLHTLIDAAWQQLLAWSAVADLNRAA
mgnify:CR=1 FL=1